MSNTAHKKNTESPVDVEGLDGVFEMDCPGLSEEKLKTVQDLTEESDSSVQDKNSEFVHPISVEEAANSLGISTNAVCKRLRKGTLLGKKVPGKFKEEWVIEGKDIIEVLNIDLTNSPENGPLDEIEEDRTVYDQTGEDASPVRDSTREESQPIKDESGTYPTNTEALANLVNLVEKQAAKLEAASGQIGYLQAKLEIQTKLLESKESEIKLLSDQHRPSTWQRFCSWFLGG